MEADLQSFVAFYLTGKKQPGRLDDIERVYSHGLSLAQCKQWLRENLPGVEKHAVVSNAEAVRRAKKSDDAAAIAGENAAKYIAAAK